MAADDLCLHPWGLFQRSIGLPDVHSGYGFAIGNVAACKTQPCAPSTPLTSHPATVDMNNPEAVVSPGGVGFDINCGVRLLRTNLTEKDVLPVKEELTQALFDHIPVGVGSKGIIPTSAKNLEAALVSTEMLGSGLSEIPTHHAPPSSKFTGNGNGLEPAGRLCLG